MTIAQTTDKPTPEALALQLRALLSEIRSITDNENLKDGTRLQDIEDSLDKYFPNWNAYEKAFLEALSCNGIDGGEAFLKLKAKGGDYMQLENGSTIYDHQCTFDAAISFANQTMVEALNK